MGDRRRGGKDGFGRMSTATTYRVGQRIVHPTFGVGLIVEVRHGRGSDVLEVVFGQELKRLSAKMAWELAPEGAEVRPETPAAAPASADSADATAEAAEAGEDGDGEILPPVAAAADSVAAMWRTEPEGEALLARWTAGEADDPARFTAGYRAERLSAWA